MIVGQEAVERTIRLLSVDGQPTKLIFAHMYMGVFFFRSVSDTIFAMPFLTILPRTTGSPRTTV
jgi:hypothetical protein